MKTYRNGLTTDDCNTPSGGDVLTKQQEAIECNINTIIARYQKTGHLPPSPKTPMYGDFTGPTTLLEAQALVKEASERFLALPSAVRELCDQNPAKYLAMAQTPDGLKAIIAAGGPADKGPGPFNPNDTKPEAKAASAGPDGTPGTP